MSYEEFLEKDSDLLTQIAEYRHNSGEHQLQIAANELEIVKLEQERTRLRSEYTINEYKAPQRNLQGEVMV